VMGSKDMSRTVKGLRKCRRRVLGLGLCVVTNNVGGLEALT